MRSDRRGSIVPYNWVEVVGGGEPEQRFIPSGVAVCTYQVATKRPSERNEAGEGVYDTDWTRIEAWEKLAKHCAQSLHEDSRLR